MVVVGRTRRTRAIRRGAAVALVLVFLLVAPAATTAAVVADDAVPGGEVTGLSYLKVAGGLWHTCGLVDDGTVRCWGYNAQGQLGDGTTQSSVVPVAVSGITTARAIAAGSYHACALLEDGTVRCWGFNGNGRLGDGTTEPSSVPVAVSGISNAVAVTAGGYHSCALLDDGTVRCWGFNGLGELGNGTTQDSPVPVAVTGLTDVVGVSAGDGHSCAVLGGGTVRCWGSNYYGQLGDGTTQDSLVPVAVSGISNAIAAAAGGYHSCALLGDGSVRCWGSNGVGQLGDGTTQDSAVPVTVTGITSAVGISVSRRYHSCAVLGDGAVRCWGFNSAGQLGDGTTQNSAVPVTVASITTAVDVAVGDYHSCAGLADGSVRCWGRNDYGQLGNGTTQNSAVPVGVLALIAARDLTVHAVVGEDATGTVTVDGAGERALSYSIVDGPSSGTVTGAGPAFTYVPDDPGRAVDDTFTYQATASDGVADTGTVTVHIAPLAPGAPGAVTASGTVGQLAVSWSAPASDGGSSLTEYEVTVTPAGGGASVVEHVAPPGTSTTVGGLAVGDYDVTVRAVNVAGPGDAATATGRVPAAGEVSGVVVDHGTSASIEGIRVRLYTPAGAFAGETFSDGSGRWGFTGQAEGSYYVQFVDKVDKLYPLEYWPDAATRPQATLVPTGTAGITGELDHVPAPPPTGDLTGTVVDDQSGDPVDQIRVRAFTPDGVLAGQTYTAPDGTWSLVGLKTGDYVLQFADKTNHAYKLEYWQNAPTLATATALLTDAMPVVARVDPVI